MTVVLHLVGGLGNQLFQLAAAAHLAGQRGRALVVDITEARLIHDRIGMLPLIEPLTTIDYAIPALPHAVNARQARLRQARSRRKAAGPTLGTIDELEQFVDDGQYSQLHMHGLFMSRAFASESCGVGGRYRPRLRQPSDWYTSMRERIDGENPIGMHVRRGDYLGEPERGVLTSSYYGGAIAEVWDGQRSIWAFSDDPQEAASFLGDLRGAPPLEFMAPPPGVAAADSMMLLAATRTIIACNSTFSWWAAFLSDAQVVIPRPFGLESLTWNEHQRNRMIDPSWTEVGAAYA